jgi:hypothetical protein
MFIVPGIMPTSTTSRLCSECSKFNAEDLLPLKLCLRFNPSSIALYYKLTQFPGEKFLHQVDIEKEIESNMTAEEIYNRLISIEPVYWNPNNVSKEQIKRLVEKLIEKNSRIKQCPMIDRNNNEPSGAGDQTPTVKIASISSSACCAPELVVNALPSLNAESLIIAQPEFDLSGRNVLNNNGKKVEENKEYINDLISTNKLQEEVDVRLNRVEKKNKIKETNNRQKELTEVTATQEDAEEEIELQKVYMNELGKNAFMDKAENLFDIEGNYLGQPEIENN